MAVKINRMIAMNRQKKFRDALPELVRRIEFIAKGRVAPSLESLAIGSARKVSAGVVFFDICDFTKLTNSDDPETLKRTLLLLNCVIPSMMQALYRYDAYIEKNTGDGLMAVVGIGNDDVKNAADLLDIAEEMFFVLHRIVNPELAKLGISPVNARIGIDMGQLLISRIGAPSGTSSHERNFLTAVGPAANLACKLQGMAGVNEVWVGDSIFRNTPRDKWFNFDCVTPPTWTWTYESNPQIRYDCWRYKGRVDPFETLLTRTV